MVFGHRINRQNPPRFVRKSVAGFVDACDILTVADSGNQPKGLALKGGAFCPRYIREQRELRY